jgi:hypothetical protein
VKTNTESFETVPSWTNPVAAFLSYRNATIGSTRNARSAGPSVATTATTPSTATTVTNVAGSDGLNSGTRNIASGFVAKMEIPSPIASPIASSPKLSHATIRSTAARSAPRATLSPISRVRRATEYASTP